MGMVLTLRVKGANDVNNDPLNLSEILEYVTIL